LKSRYSNEWDARAMYNKLERNEERAIMAWALSWKFLRMPEKITANGSPFSHRQASPEHKSVWYK
jgi:hypothetical protein